jgi:hypothetical protein
LPKLPRQEPIGSHCAEATTTRIYYLRGYLGEGAASSILIDPQAKFLGEQLRDVVVPGPT